MLWVARVQVDHKQHQQNNKQNYLCRDSVRRAWLSRVFYMTFRSRGGFSLVPDTKIDIHEYRPMLYVGRIYTNVRTQPGYTEAVFSALLKLHAFNGGAGISRSILPQHGPIAYWWHCLALGLLYSCSGRYQDFCCLIFVAIRLSIKQDSILRP